MKLEFQIFSVVFVLLSFTTKAQDSQFLHSLSIEAGWGVNYPLKLEDDFFYSPEYFGFKNFYFGGNYEINRKWGFRTTYAFNQLEGSDYSNLGVRRYKLMFEPTFDVISAIQSDKSQVKPQFDIRFHGGVGMSLGQSMYLDKMDDVTFTAQLGAMPRFRIADKTFITLDCVAVIDFGQKYDTHGVPARNKVGAYILSNIGFSYSFSNSAYKYRE